jgi:hypothetical protein
MRRHTAVYMIVVFLSSACATERADIKLADGTTVAVTCATIGQARCTITVEHAPPPEGPADPNAHPLKASELVVETGSEHVSPTAWTGLVALVQAILPALTALAAK